VRPPCAACAGWGATAPLIEAHAVHISCPACGRMTWPNLGVNVPAGAAVSLGGGNAAKEAAAEEEAEFKRRRWSRRPWGRP
jgi:hypothetical protein